ncbi:MAG: hypothetical protein VB125_02580 [Burkholderia sp.]
MHSGQDLYNNAAREIGSQATRSIGSCRGAQPHDRTRSSAVRPYCLRSKTWESLRHYVRFMQQRPFER